MERGFTVEMNLVNMGKVGDWKLTISRLRFQGEIGVDV